MTMYVSFNDGHSEWREITSFAIKDNCLVLTTPADYTRLCGDHVAGNVSYIPLYNVKEFIPSQPYGSTPVNRYIS